MGSSMFTCRAALTLVGFIALAVVASWSARASNYTFDYEKWDTAVAEHFRGPYLQTTQFTADKMPFDHGLYIAPGQTTYTIKPDQKAKLEYMRFDMVVSDQGKVIQAQPTGGSPLKYGDPRYPIESWVRTWTFAPFSRGGRAFQARIRNVPVGILRLPPNYYQRLPQLDNAPLKEHGVAMDCSGGSDWGGSGENTGFTLSVGGDGNVVYVGRRGVAIKGRHTGRTVSTAYPLFRQLFEVDPVALGSQIGPFAFDAYSGCQVKLTRGSKTLFSFYIATEVSAHEFNGPRLQNPIINAIWNVAGLDRWRRGDQRTVPALQTEGWNFKVNNPANSGMIEDVAQFGTADLLRDLIILGAPVRDKAEPPKTPGDKHMRGDTALDRAAKRGNHDMVLALLQAKRDWSKATLTRALFRIARFGGVEIARALLAAGADPKARGDYNASWLMNAASSGDPTLVALALASGGGAVNDNSSEFGITPLHEAATRWRDDGSVRRQRDRGEAVKLLLRHGAALEANQKHGGTPLIVGAYNPYVTRALLAAGANPNARDERGETALMKCPAIESARALLAAGANPHLKHDSGASTITAIKANCRDDVDRAAAIIKLVEGYR